MEDVGEVEECAHKHYSYTKIQFKNTFLMNTLTILTNLLIFN